MAIIDSIEFVDLRVRASVGGTPSPMTVSVSASPSLPTRPALAIGTGADSAHPTMLLRQPGELHARRAA
jgi:hypothetical protein